MQVRKRSGKLETVSFDKVLERVMVLSKDLDLSCDMFQPEIVAQKTIQGLKDGIETSELDILAAEEAAYLSQYHHDYGLLGGRILASNLQKSTPPTFSACIEQLYHTTHPIRRDLKTPAVSKELYDIVQQYKEVLDAEIRRERDLTYDFFGVKTLERSYLLKVNGKIVETIQYMYMRVALGMHGDDVSSAIHTYHLLSEKKLSHATPTLFNSGTPNPQMSSCFLIMMKADSIKGIYGTVMDCAEISKYAGGIGISVSHIRAKGSLIAGTNGISNGLVPMLRVLDTTAQYVDQGGGKRKGSFAIYIEPWHADIEEVMELKLNNGKEQVRARSLFYAWWVPDLFMKRVQENGKWTLFCPHECPGLCDTWGDEFEALYTLYEREDRGRKTMNAVDLWTKLCSVIQPETGGPYMMYKDTCNRTSNHQHLGTIRSSNLCCEVVQYTAPDEIAVCNLCSINLSACVNTTEKTPYMDMKMLGSLARTATINLNRVIDRNMYPVPEAKKSNLRHRPIGIGVQGLADVYMMLNLPYESEEAKQLNRDVFETIYYHANVQSMELAKEDEPYESYPGSPISKGIFQFDMWKNGIRPNPKLGLDWEGLRRDILTHGIRNSLLTAPMPTASTSQIIGNVESFEAMTTNLYARSVLSGNFVVVNKHLLKFLIREGLWTHEMKARLVLSRGSVQDFEELSPHTRAVYKTVWEMKQKTLIEMAADRGAFIDQSQSFNLYIPDCTLSRLSSAHFHGWKLGLKTGMYYLRTKTDTNPIPFTVDPELIRAVETKAKLARSVSDLVHSSSAQAERPIAVATVDPSPSDASVPVAEIMDVAKLSFEAVLIAKEQEQVGQHKEEEEEAQKVEEEEACTSCSS